MNLIVWSFTLKLVLQACYEYQLTWAWVLHIVRELSGKCQGIAECLDSGHPVMDFLEAGEGYKVQGCLPNHLVLWKLIVTKSFFALGISICSQFREILWLNTEAANCCSAVILQREIAIVTDALQELQQSVEEFQREAKVALEGPRMPSTDKLKQLIDLGQNLGVELSECKPLKWVY